MTTRDDEEIARLTAEQSAEDNDRQAPQRFGAQGRDKVLSMEALGLRSVSTDLDGSSVSGASLGQAYDEADGPPLQGRWRQQRTAPLWANVESIDGEAARIVRQALAEMTDEQRETYALVFGERLSYREAADRLGIHFTSVRDRVETLKRVVTRALVQAAGGDPEAVE